MNDKSENSVLVARQLTVGYQSKKERNSVASNIDFALGQGELMAIVGINGAGKSTLLRTLGKIQPKLSGQVLLNGKNLESLHPKSLASEISIVLTEPLASKNMTVKELVALGRQPYTNWIGALTDDDKSKIKTAIWMLELEALQHKKCYELSDGQLQRAMIARALAQDTAIILLDEPTTHLDLYHKVKILKVLKSIAHETKKTVVFTSHEIEMAIQMCDTMLLLDTTAHAFGQPCELIEQEAFEHLFPADTVSFDAKTGSFRIEK